MIRLGLCCIFRDEPIKFRTTTATAIKRLSRREARKKLAGLCAENAAALLSALRYCSEHGIGGFRVNSQILPLKTHPEVGYDLEKLADGRQIVEHLHRAVQLGQVLRQTYANCMKPWLQYDDVAQAQRIQEWKKRLLDRQR